MATNCLSLLGIGEQSAGAIARALECKNCLNRKSEIVCAVEHAGRPLAADRAGREGWRPCLANVPRLTGETCDRDAQALAIALRSGIRGAR